MSASLRTDDVEIALATAQDIQGILDLQERNLIQNGGLLSDAYTRARIERDMVEMPLIVARRGGSLVGYVISGTRASKVGVPIMEAMLRVYPGGPDAYMYGPICVAEDERGCGLAAAMYEALRARLQGREGLTFIRSDNVVSLRVHARFGMRRVAEFDYDGVTAIILSSTG
jgi:predicted GNAT superfamily acetyltransferase